MMTLHSFRLDSSWLAQHGCLGSHNTSTWCCCWCDDCDDDDEPVLRFAQRTHWSTPLSKERCAREHITPPCTQRRGWEKGKRGNWRKGMRKERESVEDRVSGRIEE